MAKLKDKNISKVGSNIEILTINTVKPNAPECYSLAAIKSVVPTYTLNLGTSLQDRSPYPYQDLYSITITFHNEHAIPSIKFDLEEIANQPGWTADFAGLNQAINDICVWMTQASGGGVPLATEATLQGVLQAIQNHQDFEMKLVRDTGNGDKVVCELAEYNETTDTYSYSYVDVGGAAYVPTGPLVYLDPSAVLNLVVAELQTLNAVDFATEATLSALSAYLQAYDFATETTLVSVQSDTSTLATPVTGLAVNGPLKATGVGTVTAGKRRVSIMNTGAAAADVNGGTNNLAPGESVTWSAEGLRDTLVAISYDGTGTELTIISVG